MKTQILIISIIASTSAFAVGEPEVKELDFNSTPSNCKQLYVTSAEGKDQSEARKAVKEAGGNAVVFHGGMITMKPETRKVKSYTSNAIIYKYHNEDGK
jgi:hypothetical protein